jgi:two-component system chemotaxis response regulator CheB
METIPQPLFVAIGASGSEGLSDISDLLGQWPEGAGIVVMVVLHRASDRPSALQEMLAKKSRIPVVVAKEGQKLVPGACYIGEPAALLTLAADGRVRLVPGEGNRLRNRTVDELFVSVASHAGRRAIGIVLSGALDDGSRGLAAIHHMGGLTMVLDPGRKSLGMQQNAINFDGPISLVGTVAEITAVITQAVVNSM